MTAEGGTTVVKPGPDQPDYWTGYKRNMAVVIRAQQIDCPEHPPPLPKPGCWQCGRNGAFERAARIVEGRFEIVAQPPGTVAMLTQPVDTAAAAATSSAIHRLIYGDTIHRDTDGELVKITWDISPGGHVTASEGWEPNVDGDGMLVSFTAIVEKTRCAQCHKPGRLCNCTGGPWPDFARPAASDLSTQAHAILRL